MITSLTEMPEFLNFGYMTSSTAWFQSRDEVLLLTSSTEIMTPQFLFYLYLRKFRVAILAYIIEIVIIFIKGIFKDRIRSYVPKWNLHLYFLFSQYLLTSGGKMLMTAEVKDCVT